MSRIGPGPVFMYETITAARRWQTFALRAAFVLMLLCGLVAIWGVKLSELDAALAKGRIAELSELGQSFFLLLASVQVGLVLLAAPAATAGAVCLDRSRGALTHALVTDLSDAEIVLGKLAARLLPVFAVISAAIPVLALASLIGGISPESLIVLTAVSVPLAVLGCSLALALSTRAKKAHEVLTAVFAVWFVWIVGLLVWYAVTEVTGGYIRTPPDWWIKLNPFVLTWAPASSPGWITGWDVLLFDGLSLGLSAVLCAYAVRRLREKDARPSSGRTRAVRGAFAAAWRAVPVFRWSGPSLDGNPVFWREWHRSRPSRLTRAVWGLEGLIMTGGFGLGLYLFVDSGVADLGEEMMILQGLGVWFGLLLVSASAPTALSEERLRGSLDVLLSTPLSARSILAAKWWGAYRRVPWIAVLPALLALVFALALPESVVRHTAVKQNGIPGVVFVVKTVPLNTYAAEQVAAAAFPAVSILACGAVVVSFGVALATWVKRPGRAMALSVSTYVVVSLGWLFLVAMSAPQTLIYKLSSGGKPPRGETLWLDVALLAFDPVGGQMASYAMTLQPGVADRAWFWAVSGAGLLAAFVLAAGLFGLTVTTFERSLGRAASARPRVASRKGVRGPHSSAPSPKYASSSSPLI